MLSTFKFVFSLIPLFILAACGGGGDSSSGGGGGNNPFAGTYVGNSKACVTSGGQTACENTPVFITIHPDGSVSSGEELTGTMNGNMYSAKLVGTFAVEGLTCAANMTGNGVVNGNNTTGNATGTVSCSNGTQFTVRQSWNLNKNTAQAFSVSFPSVWEATSNELSKALDQN